MSKADEHEMEKIKRGDELVESGLPGDGEE